jgi:hypothetical protein
VTWGFYRGEWRLKDPFGDEWRIFFVPVAARRTDGHSLDRQSRSWIEQLVFDGFAHHGATDDRIASVLLEIYDALANETLSSRLPRPTLDPQQLLVGFDRRLRHELVAALTADEIRIEQIVRPWPFPEAPEEPVAVLDVVPPVAEQTTFIAILLVDQDGNPVPGRRYRIALASGRTLSEGNLDTNGAARVDGLDPASCIVTFPDIDAGAATVGAVSGKDGQTPPPPPPDEPTWIAIHLAGDPTTYTGLAYELTAPDGSVHTGAVDGSGLVRVDGIPPGVCQIRFPDKADGDVLQVSGSS